MPTFEEGFAAAEGAALSVQKTLNDAQAIARQLRKAGQEGNIAAFRRHSERLESIVNLIRQEVANASAAWPFTGDTEREYLEDEYAEELKEEARKKGVEVFDRDGRLIAHPLVVRILPGERAVRIDRRQSSTIRPTKVVADLAKLQKSPPRFRPQPFLESLYEAYLALSRPDTADRLKLGEVGQVIRLDKMYNLFTGLPGTRRDYGLLDFARDLYALQNSGVREARSGARVSFPASTGTRTPRDSISFVGPQGESVIYYGIQFTGVGQ